MPLDEPHPIWPEGPDCDEQCPGKWSQYHDGFAWGVEKERARIKAAVEGLEEPPYRSGPGLYLDGWRDGRAAVLRIVEGRDA